MKAVYRGLGTDGIHVLLAGLVLTAANDISDAVALHFAPFSGQSGLSFAETDIHEHNEYIELSVFFHLLQENPP